MVTKFKAGRVDALVVATLLVAVDVATAGDNANLPPLPRKRRK